MEEVALFLHLLGALTFTAGVAVAGLGFESARRRDRPEEIALLLGLTRAGVLLVVTGGVVLLGCGLWLVGLAEVGYDAGWIQAAIALFAVAAVLGGLGGRRPKRARLLATGLAGRDDPVTPELRALLDDPLSRAANYASAAIVPAILALMVFKP
jgi:hypothetical protein